MRCRNDNSRQKLGVFAIGLNVLFDAVVLHSHTPTLPRFTAQFDGGVAATLPDKSERRPFDCRPGTAPRPRSSRTNLWSECHEEQPADHYHETRERKEIVEAIARHGRVSRTRTIQIGTVARATIIQFTRSVKGAASQLTTPKAMKELFRGRLCDWADAGPTGGLIL